MTEKLLFEGGARGHVIVILLYLAICTDSLEEHLRAFRGQENCNKSYKAVAQH